MDMKEIYFNHLTNDAELTVTPWKKSAATIYKPHMRNALFATHVSSSMVSTAAAAVRVGFSSQAAHMFPQCALPGGNDGNRNYLFPPFMEDISAADFFGLSALRSVACVGDRDRQA